MDSIRVSYRPTHHELEVLRAFATGDELEWGAWVGACIDFLQEGGMLTRGPQVKVTDKGREYLKSIE